MHFDYDRPDQDPEGCARHVLDETKATFRVDQTDQWVTMPLRTVITDGLGFAFEIGPYSIEGADARHLINALATYGRLSGDFRHRTEPSTAPEHATLATVHRLIPPDEPTVFEVDNATEDD